MHSYLLWASCGELWWRGNPRQQQGFVHLALGV